MRGISRSFGVVRDRSAVGIFFAELIRDNSYKTMAFLIVLSEFLDAAAVSMST